MCVVGELGRVQARAQQFDTEFNLKNENNQ